jgi:hypothetical protein
LQCSSKPTEEQLQHMRKTRTELRFIGKGSQSALDCGVPEGPGGAPHERRNRIPASMVKQPTVQGFIR